MLTNVAVFFFLIVVIVVQRHWILVIWNRRGLLNGSDVGLFFSFSFCYDVVKSVGSHFKGGYKNVT